MNSVAVIGAGFCGVSVATELLRSCGGGSTEIVLINRTGLMGRGLAYATRSDAHLLNVPAGQMSADPADPDDFLRFARSRCARVEASDLLPRALYGDYLAQRLEAASRSAAPGKSLVAMVGQVVAIETEPGTDRVVLQFEDGERRRFDRAVLASGNLPPAHPAVAAGSRLFFRSPRYVRDPWASEALRLVRPDDPVLLIGSGLTMLDVWLSLQAQGHRAPVSVISRRGLAPLPHRPAAPAGAAACALVDSLMNAEGLRARLAAVRAAVAALPPEADWREVIASLRADTPRLWQSLDAAARSRFIRHLRPYWEVHRHRCAAATARQLEQARASGALRLLAGRIVGFEQGDDAVSVEWRARGQRESARLSVAHVINCTGPDSDLRRAQDPLLSQLLGSGRLSTDPQGLGLRVDADYRLLGADDCVDPRLFYVGPLLRAGYWEATAVPELRVHARAVAHSVCRSLRARPDEARSRQYA